MDTLKILQPDDVIEALRLWHGGDPDEWPLAHLRLSRQLGQESESHRSLAESGPAAVNRAVLNRGLARLRTQAPEADDLLRQRFEHRRDVLAVANSLNVAESSLYYRQRQAISQLTDVILSLEENAGAAWRERMQSRLELPTYSELIGVDDLRSRLQAALLAENEHAIVALVGLGGLGKTAMADRLARDMLRTNRFDEIAWVTAKHTYLSTLGRLQVESGRPSLTFPMLINKLADQFDIPQQPDSSQLERQRIVKQYLRERACLVVIDNLETVADYRSLLPEITQWIYPSKFLLTSRLRLLDEADVYAVSLRELSETAAIALIQSEAKRRGFTDLAQAHQDDLKPIYDTVGGNPLALKLIVGQLRFHALPRVLARFSGGSAQPNREALYDYIYHEIWETLDNDAKTILLALTQSGESGFTFSHLAAITSMDAEQLTTTLEEMILVSLVDQRGTLQERRYRLHRLTELYLLRMFAQS